MTRKHAAILVGFLVLLLPAAGLGQNGKDEVPVKDGDEVQAEAGGKKSKKVKISDSDLKLDLSGFPDGPAKPAPLNKSAKALLDDIEKRVPGLGQRVRRTLSETPNLRDKIVYIWKVVSDMLERRDHLSVNLRKGLVSKEKIRALDAAKTSMVELKDYFLGRYTDYLSRTFPKEAAEHLWRSYHDREIRFVNELNKEWHERRKKFGLLD